MYADHGRAVLAYALRRTGPEDAADIVAETMLVAWRRLDVVPTDGGERLWLFGVARRVLANQRRGARRRSDLAAELRQRVRQATTPGHENAVAESALVERALATLDEEDRELVLLTAWEGLRPGEAAVVLGLRPSTARSRLHRARKRLQRRLDVAAPAESTDDPATGGSR
ncbi:MAG: sigma-70 family RNA polymerase sigma factor [Actinomycetota bacterium]|nr:sigma-70 family RNA polymerase sigma factor [Actinomycetota bacterium]